VGTQERRRDGIDIEQQLEDLDINAEEVIEELEGEDR
jgi:hypothetical protein